MCPRKPIKFNECQGHTYGELPLRDIRRVCVKCSFMTGSGERCDPLASPGPWLIGGDVLFWPLLLASLFISSNNCQDNSGCSVTWLWKCGAGVLRKCNTETIRPIYLQLMSWRWLGWLYTLQSSFRLFGERLRLFTGRGVSFMVTVSFPYRIHNPSRTQKLIQ